MFTKYLKTATVKRQSYSTSGGYKKGSFSAVSGIFKGHLKPARIEDGFILSATGKDYIFTTGQGSNILEGDVLTVESVDYEVKGVVDHYGISFNCKKCLVNLS